MALLKMLARLFLIDYLILVEAINNKHTVTLMKHLSRVILMTLTTFLMSNCSTPKAGKNTPAGTLPQGFVHVESLIPSIVLDMRYYTGVNFVGKRIDGYLEPRAVLTAEAADALAKVQKELRSFGLGLKIFDAYRPQQAVDHFVKWSEDLEDIKMKSDYYPDLEKKELFEQGYIAHQSGHTRGSAVDVTLVSLQTVEELDMGSGYDFFGKASWPSYEKLTSQQRANRMLLQKMMTHHGFKVYDQEWWHFWLADEPYPDTYFDFPIK